MDLKTIMAAGLSVSEKFNISFTVILTGFVVVFTVLILLILIIAAYGKIVSSAQNKSKARKEAKAAAEKAAKATEKSAPASAPVQKVAPSNGLTDEIVAVIAAAVDSTYGVGNAKIKSIKKSPSSGRPAWGQVGVIDNTRPF